MLKHDFWPRFCRLPPMTEAEIAIILFMLCPKHANFSLFNSTRVRHRLVPCTQHALRGKKTFLSVCLLFSQCCVSSHICVCFRATRLFCDVYNPQSKTYCKRLQVLCPEHSRDPKVCQLVFLFAWCLYIRIVITRKCSFNQNDCTPLQILTCLQ